MHMHKELHQLVVYITRVQSALGTNYYQAVFPIFYAHK